MKRYKDLVKINPAPKSRFGVNPSDPWSAKAGLAEGRNSILKKFILSKGIDPVTLSGDSMIAFSKSLEFQKWAADRKLRGEAVESPAMLSQRRLQKKISKHQNIGPVGGLGEESDLDETYPGHSSTVKNPNFNDELSIRRVGPSGRRLKSGKLSADERGQQERTKRLMQFTKAKGGLTGPKGNLPEAVDRKDTVTFDIPLLIRLLELAREDIKTDMDLHRVVERIINIRNKGVLTMDDYDNVADINDKKYKKTNSNLRAIRAKNVANKIKVSAVRKEGMSEDKYQDPNAATQTVGMEVESKKRFRTLRKESVMREELYDWEKEDKSVQSYGKKPKFAKPNPNSKSNLAADTNVSRAVMSGGTTLTGEKRDDVEIDPMMKNRPTIPMDDNKKVKKAKI